MCNLDLPPYTHHQNSYRGLQLSVFPTFQTVKIIFLLLTSHFSYTLHFLHSKNGLLKVNYCFTTIHSTISFNLPQNLLKQKPCKYSHYPYHHVHLPRRSSFLKIPFLASHFVSNSSTTLIIFTENTKSIKMYSATLIFLNKTSRKISFNISKDMQALFYCTNFFSCKLCPTIPTARTPEGPSVNTLPTFSAIGSTGTTNIVKILLFPGFSDLYSPHTCAKLEISIATTHIDVNCHPHKLFIFFNHFPGFLVKNKNNKNHKNGPSTTNPKYLKDLFITEIFEAPREAPEETSRESTLEISDKSSGKLLLILQPPTLRPRYHPKSSQNKYQSQGREKYLKILTKMCHILLKIVKIKKHWLNDTCNRSSYRAIKDHLNYLQEDFYGKPSGVGESFRKEQRTESTRTHSEPLLSQSRKPATPPHPSMSTRSHASGPSRLEIFNYSNMSNAPSPVLREYLNPIAENEFLHFAFDLNLKNIEEVTKSLCLQSIPKITEKLSQACEHLPKMEANISTLVLCHMLGILWKIKSLNQTKFLKLVLTKTSQISTTQFHDSSPSSSREKKDAPAHWHCSQNLTAHGNVTSQSTQNHFLGRVNMTTVTANKTCSTTCTLMHIHCADCKVTVPKVLHRQTCGVWMEPWLDHDACQLNAVDKISHVGFDRDDLNNSPFTLSFSLFRIDLSFNSLFDSTLFLVQHSCSIQIDTTQDQHFHEKSWYQPSPQEFQITSYLITSLNVFSLSFFPIFSSLLFDPKKLNPFFLDPDSLFIPSYTALSISSISIVLTSFFYHSLCLVLIFRNKLFKHLDFNSWTSQSRESLVTKLYGANGINLNLIHFASKMKVLMKNTFHHASKFFERIWESSNLHLLTL
ncbi:hypothetical protein VP01_160g2 [Puccinia sorghi]|uniref:Uncharacterized protein n=1 Tax=Puccinia sorghi TaxID=27349 RepID=A0A0L6VH88_9BASI|nr:hypothetical protein VP01_160g2 [Puccinia sorghi]